ncbi:MAG: hypothetical protein AAF890_03340 [Pseudomonadota bacterium]
MIASSAKADLHTRSVARRSGAQIIRPDCFAHVVTQPQNAFAATETELLTLDRLRWLAMRACLRGQEDVEKACFVLAATEDESFERFGMVFFSTLRSHARHGLTFHRPGATGLGPDEVWVLRLLRNAGDPHMLSRMVAWHVEPHAQRWFRFLANGLARLA